MPHYNRVTLVGNVVRDGNAFVTSGAVMTKFTIAVNRKSKDADSADYIDVVAGDKLAETSNTYLQKGTLLLVEALSDPRLRIEEGEKHKSAEVVMSLLQMFSPRASAGDNPSEADLEAGFA